MRVSRMQRITGAIRVITLDLSQKKIGDKGAAEAVAVMLLWNAPSMTKLDLRYVPVDPTRVSSTAVPSGESFLFSFSAHSLKKKGGAVATTNESNGHDALHSRRGRWKRSSIGYHSNRHIIIC
jgi:hypothetical protein